METSIPEAKYHKLATEYAKVRAQAGVLKKAVLEEQAKCSNLRDQLRQRETSLRRSEQEVDSLGFRNKQLEHRVSVLQDEIAKREGRTLRSDVGKQRSGKLGLVSGGHSGAGGIGGNGAGDEAVQNTLIFEELQKKIMENAQLTSLIDDKERDLQLHVERIAGLEHLLEQRNSEQSDLEKRLRRDLDTLQTRNAELETKLVEAASMLGSEDALSVSGSEHTTPPCPATSTATTTSALYNQDERIAWLQREVAHWRAQFEIAQLTDSKAKLTNTPNNNNNNLKLATNAARSVLEEQCSCSSSAAGISVLESSTETKETTHPPSSEQIMYNSFALKFEDLLQAKCVAESHLNSYATEVEHLQNCLENATHELKAKDEHIHSINRALQMLEEDLATTRINYEEQIMVLTEQVVSLSEQLAACK